MVDAQIKALDQATICGNIVAFLQKDDIPRDDFFGQNLFFFAIAHDARGGRQYFAQGFGCLLRAEFLEEAESPVDDVDHPDCDGKLGHLCNQSADAGNPKHDGHQVGKLSQQL